MVILADEEGMAAPLIAAMRATLDIIDARRAQRRADRETSAAVAEVLRGYDRGRGYAASRVPPEELRRRRRYPHRKRGTAAAGSACGGRLVVQRGTP